MDDPRPQHLRRSRRLGVATLAWGLPRPSAALAFLLGALSVVAVLRESRRAIAGPPSSTSVVRDDVPRRAHGDSKAPSVPSPDGRRPDGSPADPRGCPVGSSSHGPGGSTGGMGAERADVALLSSGGVPTKPVLSGDGALASFAWRAVDAKADHLRPPRLPPRDSRSLSRRDASRGPGAPRAPPCS